MSTTQTFTLIIWENLNFYKAFQVEILVIRTCILFSSITCKYKANIMPYSLNIMLFGLTQNRITTTTKKYKTNIKIIKIIKSNKSTRIKRCHIILRQLHKFEKLQNVYVIFLYIFLCCFSLSHLQTRRSHGLPGWGHTTGTSATDNERQRAWYTVSWWVKDALSDFCQIMLVFESTKTNMPIAQHDLAHILISPPHTYVRNHCRTTITETQAYSNKSQQR